MPLKNNTSGQWPWAGKAGATKMTGTSTLKVAVLMGGRSAERTVSLSSGAGCAAALRAEGFDVVEIDAAIDVCAQLTAAKPDVVFNALHGRFGEDGCVQGMLEWMGIPYTHSGVQASALAMDKTRSKQLFESVGLPVLPSVIEPKSEIMKAHVLPPPYVVKPNDEGSSVGIYIVNEGAPPPKIADTMPDNLLVEAYAPGRELTASVLGDRALSVTEIITDGWYDFDAKYAPGGSQHIVPADIPSDIFDLCLAHALKAHQVLGCRGLSRTDFRWDETRGADGLMVLELNTQPGMTPTSLSPEHAQICGMDFGALCRWLVEDASCAR